MWPGLLCQRHLELHLQIIDQNQFHTHNLTIRKVIKCYFSEDQKEKMNTKIAFAAVLSVNPLRVLYSSARYPWKRTTSKTETKLQLLLISDSFSSWWKMLQWPCIYIQLAIQSWDLWTSLSYNRPQRFNVNLCFILIGYCI